MQRIPLRRKWWPFYLACGLALSLQVIFSLITWPGIKARLSGLSDYPSLTWREIILTHVVTIAIGLALCLYALFHMMPEISTEGIWRRGLFNATYIRWQDVIAVSVSSVGYGFYIDLQSQTRTIRVIPGFYQNPQELFAAINEYVPKEALSTPVK